jgi:hypothetical protein
VQEEKHKEEKKLCKELENQLKILLLNEKKRLSCDTGRTSVGVSKHFFEM